VGGGSDHGFCELNRRRPRPGSLDVIAFPVVPQVHATDDLSLVETHQVLGDVLATCRSFAGGAAIAVGPVTLRARRTPGEAAPAAEADPRQPAPFAAAWLLGELSGLLGAGADAVTAFATTGPHGVLAEEAGTVRALPVLDVLADVAALRGREVLPVRGYDPLRTASLAVADGGRARLLLADLTGRPDRVALPDGSDGVAVHEAGRWVPLLPRPRRHVEVAGSSRLRVDVPR
jgi:hypothetical protein